MNQVTFDFMVKYKCGFFDHMVKNNFDDSWRLPGLLDLAPSTVFPARDQVTFDFMVKKVVIYARFNKP